jgi:hypothetical protein
MNTIVISIHRRRRIEMQGFSGLDDETLLTLEPWFRLAPAICMVWTAMGTFKASPLVIWSLVPLAGLGAVLRWHPFNLIYHWGFRPLLNSLPIPRYETPRRFACAVAAVWLGFTGWASFAGADFWGWFLGTLMSLMALQRMCAVLLIVFELFRLVAFFEPGISFHVVSTPLPITGLILR